MQRLLSSRKDVLPDYTRETFEQKFSGLFDIRESAAIPDSGRVLYRMTRRAAAADISSVQGSIALSAEKNCRRLSGPNRQKFKVMAPWAQSGQSVCPVPTSLPSTPHSVTDSLNDSPGQSTPKWR